MTEEEVALREIRTILEKVAAEGDALAYSEVVPQVKAMHLERDSPLLARLLDEISRQTDAEGKGMLSAVVIHKGDDYLPGKGFFKLGKELGRDISVREVFYAMELKRVHAAFAG
jgi:hypothetical protein